MKNLAALIFVIGPLFFFHSAHAKDYYKSVIKLTAIGMSIDNKSRRGNTVTDIGLEDKTGGQISYEFRPMKNLGIAASYSETRHNLLLPVLAPVPQGSGDVARGRSKFKPFTIGVNYHFVTSDGRADFYIGPSLGFAKLSGAVNSKRKSSLGLNAGVDLGLGAEKRFVITLGGGFTLSKYKFKQRNTTEVPYDRNDPDSAVLTIPAGTKYDLRPWHLQAGVGFRF